MDYERIEKPLHQGGGFSPKKLRAMLLGVEKRRKEEEEIESKFSLQTESSVTEIDERRGSIGEELKDVDVISSLSDPSTLLKLATSKSIKTQEEDPYDSESVASLNFEFHKETRNSNPNPNPNRSPVVPLFSKPAPSKWADAQKWIASPISSRASKPGKKGERVGFGGSKNPVTKIVLEATIEEADTKRVDLGQEKKEIGWNNRSTNWVPDPYPEIESFSKTVPSVENCVAGSAVNLSRHDTSISLQSATTFLSPPSTVRSVSMRDMGTEMTPIASQEPSRTGTPVRPASPNQSNPASPRHSLTGSDPNPNPNPNPLLKDGDTSGGKNVAEMSEREIQMKTRREIMILGTQLGKPSIAAWASKQEEEKDESVGLSVIETRAAAWEEAEKAKYIARFKREEIKIQAWEDHQKAKIEAEMRKIEVEVERMRAKAHDRLMSRLADTRHMAEEKRATAETRRSHAAARTTQQAEYIRRTGRVPPSLFSCYCWGWCS